MFPQMRRSGRYACGVGFLSNFGRISFSGPLCPKPPEIPEDGIQDFEPIVFEQEVAQVCNIEGETMEIRCHSFQSIYARKSMYGRNYTNEKKLCDGEKPDDLKGVDDEGDFCLRHHSSPVRKNCHGESFCIVPVTGDMDKDWANKFDSQCAPLKKELRVDYICGRLTHSYFMLF